jgi:hypothetical protein
MKRRMQWHVRRSRSRKELVMFLPVRGFVQHIFNKIFLPFHQITYIFSLDSMISGISHINSSTYQINHIGPEESPGDSMISGISHIKSWYCLNSMCVLNFIHMIMYCFQIVTDVNSWFGIPFLLLSWLNLLIRDVMILSSGVSCWSSYHTQRRWDDLVKLCIIIYHIILNYNCRLWFKFSMIQMTQ